MVPAMSDAAQQLLVSTGFITSIAIGALGVIGVMIWAAVNRRPAPFGGLVLAGGMVIAMSMDGHVPKRLVVGLVLFVIAGLIPVRSYLLTMLLLVPGVAIVASTQLPRTQTSAATVAVLAMLALAPLVASFDVRHASNGVATTLIAISILTVFGTVPDTEVAVVAAGAALPWLLAGPPARAALLGRPGAFAVVGLLVWLVASGGYARTLALIAGVATLGVLVIEPVVAAVRPPSRSDDAETDSPRPRAAAALIAAHIALMALISIAVRI